MPAQSKPVTPQGILPSGILGPEFMISQDTTPLGESGNEQVAFNSKHNEYLVVYDVQPPGQPKQVFARRVTGSGLGALDAFAIGDASGDNFDPSVAYDPVNDRYLIVWSANFNGEFPKYDIYGRVVTWDGLTLYNPKKIYTWAERSFVHSQVVYDSVQKDYLVAWTALVFPQATISDVAIVRVTANGDWENNNNPMVQLMATTGNPDEVDLAYQPANDQVLAAWSEDYARSQTDTGRRVSVMLLNHDLTIANPAHQLSFCTNAANHDDPSLIPYASGHFIAACMERRVGNYSNGTEMKELDETGNEMINGGKGGVWAAWPFGTQDLATSPGSTEWLQLFDMQSFNSSDHEIEAMRNSNIGNGPINGFYPPTNDVRNPRVAQDSPGLIVYQGRKNGTDPLRIYGRTWVPWPLFLPFIKR